MTRIPAKPSMSCRSDAEPTVAGNMDVVLAYVNAFNRGDVDALAKLFAPEAVIQGVLACGGIEAVIPIWRELIDGLAMQLTVEDMVGSGDTVAVRYKERGSFRRPFLGQAPTGRSYELDAMEWFVCRDGLITARWGARDAASQARQIGLRL